MAPKKQIPVLGIMPEGTLLEFNVDLSTDFGFAYERFLNFEKDCHAHDRFVICAARGPCVFEVTEHKSGKKFTNSKDSIILKPPGSTHSLKSLKIIYENFVYLPTFERMKRIADELKISSDEWQLLQRGIISLPRGQWLDALVERFFLKRLFKADAKTLRTLEDEIIKEVITLAVGGKVSSGTNLDQMGNGFQQVIEYIEGSLFSKINLENIVEAAGMSRATLLRLFKANLNLSPMAYIRQRRMEEAQHLIKKGTYNITEIAYLVGYEDSSAFSRAYKVHFGETPAECEA